MNNSNIVDAALKYPYQIYDAIRRVSRHKNANTKSRIVTISRNEKPCSGLNSVTDSLSPRRLGINAGGRYYRVSQAHCSIKP